MKMLRLVLFASCLLLITSSVDGMLFIYNESYLIWNFFVCLATECVHRMFKQGPLQSTVCVCNSTVCDTFPQLTKTAKGAVTAYVSSKSGDRFTKQGVVHFSKQPIAHVASTVTITLDQSLVIFRLFSNHFINLRSI